MKRAITIGRNTHSAVDPYADVQIRYGAAGRSGHVVFDDFSALFDLRAPEQRAHFDFAVLGASARVMPRLSALSLGPEFVAASGWLPDEISVAIKAPSTLVTARDRVGTADFIGECRLGGGRVILAHQAGFSFAVSKRKKVGEEFVHLHQVHADEEAGIQLPKHPDLWAFLERCTPEADIIVGDTDSCATVKANTFRGLIDAGHFARMLRGIESTPLLPSDTFQLQDATSREVLESMRWLCITSDPAFDYAFSVTVGGARPDELESFPGWLWLPVCINLARARVITWLGADGSVLVGDEGAGLTIDRIRVVAVEVLRGRWRMQEKAPVLVLHPRWVALSLANGIEKAKTLARELGVFTLVARDREAGTKLLQENRPNAQLWRTIA